MKDRPPNPFKLAFLALMGIVAYMYFVDGASSATLGGLLLFVGIPFVIVGGMFLRFVTKWATIRFPPPRPPIRPRYETEIIEIKVPDRLVEVPKPKPEAVKITYGMP